MAYERLAVGRLVTVPLAGHAVMMDNPAECSTTISRFIDSVSTTSLAQRDEPMTPQKDGLRSLKVWRYLCNTSFGSRYLRSRFASPRQGEPFN